MAPATGACRPHIARLFPPVVVGRRRDRQKFSGAGEAGFACRGGEQAIVTDAMEPARQDVKEAVDELVGCQRHDALPLPAIAPVILARLSQLAAKKPVDLPVFWSVASQGRHHSGRCHYDAVTPSGVIRGGGWLGKLILSR
jgi:hypothetical protein